MIFGNHLRAFSFGLKFLLEVLVDFMTSNKIAMLSRNNYHLLHVNSCSLCHAAANIVQVKKMRLLEAG